MTGRPGENHYRHVPRILGTIESNVYERSGDYPDDWANHVVQDSEAVVTVRLLFRGQTEYWRHIIDVDWMATSGEGAASVADEPPQAATAVKIRAEVSQVTWFLVINS